MIQLPIALQMYSLHRIFPERPLEAMRMAKAAGFQAVEFYGDYFETEFYCALMQQTGMACAGWHVLIDDLEKDFDRILKRSLATGCKYIIVPIYVCDSAEGYVEFAQRLNVMAEKLAPYGIRTGYHAHACDFKEFDGVAIWDIIAQNTCPEVVLQLDTGNAACGGADVLTTFAKYPGRNQSVHFKPYHKDDELAGIGKDQLPWNECFEWCEGPGRTEWIVVEYEHDVDMTAMLNDTYSFLRSVRPL